MQKIFLMSGALAAALAVMIGAFGAHALKDFLTSNNRLETFETAVKYHFYHALGLLLIGILINQKPSIWFNYAGYGLLVGMIIFSVSLYILCLTNLKWLGAITPLGGLAMIIGWICLFIGVYKENF
ncbi:MAG: DUF423 domain-containing protein [Bacteroidetes bacterium]|nr:MAG: DUF423 domain-containing protein [Bacteroidota bacterium]